MTAATTESQEQTTPTESATISGGHLVAKALKAEGIEVIFTLCGGHIIYIYDGCIDEGIKVVAVSYTHLTLPTILLV